MKNRLYFVALLSLFLIGSGCKKEPFNFNRLNNIEASGEWGIPILNATYNIENILAQLHDNDYIFQDAEGNLCLNYNFEKNGIVTDSMLMSLPDHTSQYRWNEEIPSFAGVSIERNTTFRFRIPEEDLIIKRGVVMHGQLNLNVSNNVGSVILNCNSIKDASGRSFRREIAGNYHETIDLSNYRVEFSYNDTNTLVIDALFTMESNTDGPVNYYFNMDVTFRTLRLKEATGKLRSYTEDYKDNMNIGNLFESDNFGGNFTLYNPKISLRIKNGFSRIRGDIYIDTFRFENANGGYSNILAQYPTNVQILEGMNGEYPLQSPSSIYFSSNFKELLFKGRAIVNPLGFDAGEISIRENSSLDVSATVGIPFDLKVDDLYFHDTIDFSLDSVNLQNVIQSIVFRYSIGNSLPFTLNTQIYFYNSIEKVLVDSLFHPYLTINGSFTDKSMIETRSILEVEQDRVDKVLTCDQIIFKIKINTNGRQVSVNARNGIKAILGMKLKYDAQEFPVF